MAWIKRNIFFVISVAIGLGLTGYCGYLLYTSLNANAGVSQDYESTLASLQQIQDKSPYPSKENIQAAKADEERVRQFLADFRKRFESFPTPPAKDEKGFKTYLDDTLVRFRAGATNAGVEVPDDFGFAFASLETKLTYPTESIGPWMQQLEEIDAILDILYHAKINYLHDLARVPVSPDDAGAGLQAASVTNQWGVVTPYKISFRGFSAEIAAVMEGFARSSHCFIIKAITVGTDGALPSSTGQEYTRQGAPTFTPRIQNFAPQRNPDMEMQHPIHHRGPGGGEDQFRRPTPTPFTPPLVASYAAAPTGPVTILTENPLLVTIAVDVVKLKASEH
jgi:hypothetical protein